MAEVQTFVFKILKVDLDSVGRHHFKVKVDFAALIFVFIVNFFFLFCLIRFLAIFITANNKCEVIAVFFLLDSIGVVFYLIVEEILR